VTLCVDGCVGPNISKAHSAFIFSIKQSLFLDCHIPEALNAYQDCWENLRSSITHAVWQVVSRINRRVGVGVLLYCVHMVVQHVLRLNPEVWLVNVLTTQYMVLENIQYFLRVCFSSLLCCTHGFR